MSYALFNLLAAATLMVRSPFSKFMWLVFTVMATYYLWYYDLQQ